MDRERVIRAVDSCFDYWLDQHRNLHPLELETVRQFKAEAIALLKEQEKPNGKCVNECECWDSAYERGKQDALKEQEARWISVPHKRARICSHCEADEPYKFADDDAEVYEYCPHCGAKMMN